MVCSRGIGQHRHIAVAVIAELNSCAVRPGDAGHSAQRIMAVRGGAAFRVGLRGKKTFRGIAEARRPGIGGKRGQTF